jgi:hypothetical protein
MNFETYYFTEKSIDVNPFSPDKQRILGKKDQICINYGKKLADRFDLILNGWQEWMFILTIPKNVPNAQNTFTAKNEQEIVKQLQLKFPDYWKYIVQKKFPNGYEPDSTIPNFPPEECEFVDINTWAETLKKEKEMAKASA